jgi:hypothetical protein
MFDTSGPDGFETVMDRALDVVTAPSSSVARAVSVYDPAVAPFQVNA